MWRKTAWSLFAIAVVALALSGAADRLGQQYAADALERALITFAVARGLDSVISIAQGTEVAVEPGGVGVNLSVGQILDPVNDLIERFSTVMLTVTAALGLQEILLRITGSSGVSYLLGGAATLALAMLWIPALTRHTHVQTFALRFLLIAFAVRFAVPFLVVSTNVVFDRFLEADQIEAIDALKVATAEIEDLSRDEPSASTEDERNWFERMGDRISDSFAALNVRERMEALQESASGVTRQIVNLIVIFLLQTIALPLAFLWLLAEGVKALAGRATRPAE
ncbi:MAG: hypothetical protein AAGF46_07055 [Pseudomonadota bacterium]